MSEAGYERLSAVDAAFLSIEDDAAYTHVGGIILMDASTLTAPHGGVDLEQFRLYLESAVMQTPRLRQRLQKTPGFGHPVWVEDAHFRLDYHLRHTALPRPGGMNELHRLAGRIFSQRLDRERPLWEMWVVEGLDGDRFALIPKIHHCLLDGVGAVGLMAALAGARKTAALPTEPPPPPQPTRSDLWWGEVKHRLEGVQQTLRSARDAVQQVRDGNAGAGDLAKGLGGALKHSLSSVTATPLNPEQLGPHRRFETLRMDLKEVKGIKKQLGGTLNDVVLAIVTGGLRTYLARRGVDLSDIERFRAMLPANTRTGAPGANMGNRISLLLAELPLDENDPLERLRRIREETSYLKDESNEVAGAELIGKLDDGLGLGLVASTFKLAINRRAFNLVVTNVPGPPMSLNLFGAKLLGVHALVPLFSHQALGIALFSYDGGLYWGFNADWDAIADLPALVSDVVESFEQLKEAARVHDEQETRV